MDLEDTIREVLMKHVATDYGRCNIDPEECGFEFDYDWDVWAGHAAAVLAAAIEDALGLTREDGAEIYLSTGEYLRTECLPWTDRIAEIIETSDRFRRVERYVSEWAPVVPQNS